MISRKAVDDAVDWSGYSLHRRKVPYKRHRRKVPKGSATPTSRLSPSIKLTAFGTVDGNGRGLAKPAAYLVLAPGRRNGPRREARALVDIIAFAAKTRVFVRKFDFTPIGKMDMCFHERKKNGNPNSVCGQIALPHGFKAAHHACPASARASIASIAATAATASSSSSTTTSRARNAVTATATTATSRKGASPLRHDSLFSRG